ncbi:MAG: hypothetical protein WCZ23_03965 [Rhodospirillaceae bacterium]
MRPILIGLAVLTLGFTPALIGVTLAAPPPHAAGAVDGGKGKPDRNHGKEHGKVHGKDKGKGSVKDDTVADRVLTDIENAILREYFGKGDADTSRKGLPPGLAKRDSLPPGLAKQLDRNGRLPPGLEGRALPDDLERRLPRRAGTKRVIVDNDIVLIEDGTRLVLDVLRGAAGGK